MYVSRLMHTQCSSKCSKSCNEIVFLCLLVAESWCDNSFCKSGLSS